VPEAIIAFLDADSYEDAVRNAISLGGDSDTLACIAGGIAEAFYGGVGEGIETAVRARLTPDLYDIVQRFRAIYI
jgi:ADP-ribosylglycohydrolase